MKKYLFFFIGSFFTIVIHRYLALRHWYVKIWWLDIALHAIGALFLFALYKIFIRKGSLFGFFVFLIIAGSLWEVFEFFFNGPLFGVEEARLDNPIWLLDTIKDLLVDLVAGMLWWQVISKYNKHNV